MASRSIPRDELSFGRAVLLATDSVGMSAEGAFWLYNDEQSKWDYFLVTSLFDRLGPREVLERLARALTEKLSESEIEEFLFYVSGPNDALIRSISKQVRTSPHASAPIHDEIILNGRKQSIYVYRMADGLSKSKVEVAKRRFKQLSDELALA